MAHLSRKRKVTPAVHGGTIPESDFEHCFPRESNLLHENGSFSGINVQGNSLGGFINQISQSAEPMTFRHQFEEVNENQDFFKLGVDRISSCSSSVLPQYFHYRGPISSADTMTASNWKPKANTYSQTETGKTFPVLNSEKVAICPGLKNLLDPGHGNFFLATNQPLEVCNLASKSLRSLELLQQSSVNPDGIAINLDGKSCTWEASNYGSSCNLKRRCHSPKSAGIIGRSSFEVSARIEQNVIDRSLPNVQFGDRPSIVCLGYNFKEKDQGNRDGSIQGMEKTEALEIKILKHSLTDATLPNNGDSPANVDAVLGQRSDQSDGSLISDEKNKPPAGKVAPKVAEELWDGFLQLNSSVTVSAVAFFKSGDKMPDVKWSESVEVKGKVRLEAFEKYIQDLPRSRNRGLMVISLCWKEGSSKTGLMGMKKVAKGYKEGEKVGFAQLSPGTDLYICPRSHAIVTILAKYGFFKGMAAVEDNPNSLIGCVVWRRNQPSSNLVVKKSERKNCSLSEQPPNSPSDPTTQKDGGKKCCIQLSKSSIPVASTTDCTTLECEGNNNSGSKNLECSKVQPEVCNSSTSANSLVTPSGPSNTSSIAVGLKASLCSDHPSLQGPRWWSLEVEAPLTYSSGLEKPKPSLELQRRISYLSSKAIKESAPTLDDDDLPEYDFATACGIAQTALSKPLETAIVGKKLPAEGCGKLDGSLPPIIPTVQSLPTPNERSEHPNIQLPLDVIHKMSLPKKAFGSDQIQVFPILEEKRTAQSTATLSSVSFSAVRPQKNLFAEDDDDIPEWFPPNVELHNQSIPKMNRPSSTCIPSKAPSTSFESFCPGHPRPLLPPPLLVTTHPSFSTQAFPRAYHCPTTIIAKPAQPRPANGYVQRGPSSSMGFNSNQTSGPFPTFDINLPSHPPIWRGWRP